MIGYSERLSDSPALVFCVQAHAELLGKGHTDVPVLAHDDEVIYYEPDSPDLIDSVLGAIVFFEAEDEKVFWVNLSYTSPLFRSQGIFSRLWGALVELARSRGIRKIISGSVADNLPMRMANEKFGRKLKWYLYEYEVER